MKYCEECGAVLEDDAIFCEECGTRVSEDMPLPQIEKAPEATVPSKKPKRFLLPVFLLMFFCIGGFLGWRYLDRTGGADERKPVEQAIESEMSIRPEETAASEDASDPEDTSEPEEKKESVEAKEPAEVKENEETKEPEEEEEPKIAKEPVSLADVYEYVPIFEEVAKREIYPSKYYNTAPGYPICKDSFWGSRYLKSCPRDIRICGEDIASSTRIESVLIQIDREEDKEIKLTEADYCWEYGNMITISADFLEKLDYGVHDIIIITDSTFRVEGVKVERADAEEEQFRLWASTSTAFYSSKSKNDVVFFIYNTSSPIASVIIPGVDEPEFDLVDDGFGIVFHSEFLNQHTDKEGLQVHISLTDGRSRDVYIINLNHF